MSNQPEATSASSSREKVATFMRLGGWACFWSQLVLGVVSIGMLLVASSSLGSANAASGGGLLFAWLGLGMLGFSIFLAFRYPQLARKLRSPTPSQRPTRADTTQQVRMALISNTTGMFISLMAAEAIGGTLFIKFLSQPQSSIATVESMRQFVQPLEILGVLGNIHTIFAHFLGIAAALLLLNEIHK
jgi:hypothetical protein